MNIELKEITVGELADGYQDNAEGGVIGFGGKLDIRPKYQREFVYKDKQRDAVIDTLTKDFPLNVMYWSVRDNGGFEVIDGQQRTISICEYVAGKFSLNNLYFHSLQDVEQEQILDYKLMIYFCDGNDKEKLDWFKTINIAGEELSDQELRNAIYTGAWLTDAKRHFSKSGCPAYEMGNKLLKGSSIRQEYLETIIKWISNNNIEQYMADNQHEPNANELWLYFKNVLDWVSVVFIQYRKDMKGVDFGVLFNDFKDKKFDSNKIEKEISNLMQDEDVGKKSGIYPYIVLRNEKYLSIRAFTDKQKIEAYERQQGVCAKCNKKFKQTEMEADHIKPWSKGGKTIPENCQMLCNPCNRTKSNK